MKRSMKDEEDCVKGGEQATMAPPAVSMPWGGKGWVPTKLAGWKTVSLVF